MVSTKALAAIALTLIIAMPIGIGFLTAVHQEETDSWQTTSSSKISDLMLNHQTPFYGSYKGSSNNSALYFVDEYSETTIAPEYVSETTTYSSLPKYTSVDETFTVPRATLVATTSATTFTIPSERVGGTHDAYKVSGGIFRLNYTKDSQTYTVKFDGFNVDNITSFDTDTVYILRDSANTWELWSASLTGGEAIITGDPIKIDSGISNFTFTTTSSRVNSTWYDFVEIDATTPYNVEITDWGAYRIGNNYYPYCYRGFEDYNLRVTSSSILLEGEKVGTNEPVYALSWTANIIAHETTPSGQFADPAEGWTLPTVNETYTWLNNQVNNSVTFYAKLTNGTSLTVGSELVIMRTAMGVNVTYSSTMNLGDYTNLQIVVTNGAYTITGIPSWPAMGQVPSTFNTITIDRSPIVEDFEGVELSVSSKNVHLRVDNANIIQGEYPTTYNYNLDLNQIYPNTSIDVYINSVGIYGDFLNIGGVNVPVENGSITIAGKTYRVLHAHISAWITEAGYSVRINGDEITVTPQPPTIFFGGEWSVTATAYKIEKVHEYVTVWHAGEFGLDKKGFAVAGLLACAAMFVALGMTGQRSGGKAGVLLLICGGAAIVFLLII